METEYGKIISGATSVKCNTYEYPKYVDLKRAETCPEGYLPVEKVLPKPDVPDGKWLAFTYTNTGTALRKEYFLVNEGESAYVPVRRFSKMKCVAALMKAGVWTTVKQWIEDNGLYDLYLAAQDFEEGNEYFILGKSQIGAAIGWTDEQIEALLAQCVAS